MSKTTQEWQQLLDGTTEGPWEWIDEPDDADAQYIVDCNTGHMCLSVDAIGSGSAYGPSDPLLAAAAPEAVAEVVRLRRALEELLDTLSKAKLDSARGDYEYGQHTGFLMASSRITRILEGHNDE